jgi:hypothetical protein
LKTIGYKQALISVSLSVAAALVISGVIRVLLETSRYLLT